MTHDDPAGARPVLTSARNPRIVAAAGLRERRARDEAGLTLVDGVRELARALRGSASVVEVFVDDGRLSPEGVDVVRRAGQAGADTRLPSV
jgi:TrmH family RNA methyltransferase